MDNIYHEKLFLFENMDKYESKKYNKGDWTMDRTPKPWLDKSKIFGSNLFRPKDTRRNTADAVSQREVSAVPDEAQEPQVVKEVFESVAKQTKPIGAPVASRREWMRKS